MMFPPSRLLWHRLEPTSAKPRCPSSNTNLPSRLSFLPCFACPLQVPCKSLVLVHENLKSKSKPLQKQTNQRLEILCTVKSLLYFQVPSTLVCTVKFSKEVGPINHITSRVCSRLSYCTPNILSHRPFPAACRFPILNPTLHTVQLELAIQKKQAISSRVLTIKRPKYCSLFLSKSPRLFLIVPIFTYHTVVCSKHEHDDDDEEDDD